MNKDKEHKLIKTLAKLWKRVAWKELEYVDSEDFKPLPYIDRGGTELEGAHADMHDCGNGSWHGDCSVEVSGYSSDDDSGYDCECYDDCECDMCEICTHCDNHPDDCECSACHLCSECCEHADECVCEMIHYSSCEVVTCTDERPCSNCRDQWAEDNYYYDCREMSNFTWRCSRDCYCDCVCSSSNHIDGEKVSQPMPTKELMHYINNFYPEETNSTCGAHKHTSVTNSVKNYSILMEEQFSEFIILALFKWAECLGVRKSSSFYHRMNGENSMCVPRYRVYDQFMAYDKPDDRYCAVNYCYANHKTIEVRVLPAFQDKRLTISSSLAVEQIISSYLSSNQNTLQIHRGTN